MNIYICKNPLHALELNQVSRVCLRIVKDHIDLWIVALIHSAIIENLASAVACREYLHLRLALRAVARQYSAVKHVFVAVHVGRRVRKVC